MVRESKFEAGFTLISTLISLSLVLISLPLIYQLVYEVKSISKFELSPYKFMVFIKDDIHRSEKMIAKDDKLYFYRSEEHTSELQSRFDLVCRLLLEKKKITKKKHQNNALKE